jgi:phage host-nuclease inhibitor protein Gam
MARVKATDDRLNSWDDVDRIFRLICEAELAIEEQQTEMRRAIDEAKERAVRMTSPIRTSIDTLAGQIKAFVNEERDNMEGKTKFLTFGTVGFRKSTEIGFARGFKSEDVIAKLRELGFGDCVSVTEKVNRDVLRTKPDKVLEAVGAVKRVKDDFWYESNKEKLR